jgi:hypothetical protein
MIVTPMYRTPPKKTPRVAAVVARHLTAALVVLDPWEVRVAMVAPIATVRLALLRERPSAVATNRRWPWLRRTGLDLATTDLSTTDLVPADHPEMRRFAGTRDEPLLRRALILAIQLLNQTLHDQLVSENRSRPSAHPARANAPTGSTSRFSVLRGL